MPNTFLTSGSHMWFKGWIASYLCLEGEEKWILKSIVGYRTCDYTNLAMINSAISTFKVVVEKLTTILKLW